MARYSNPLTKAFPRAFVSPRYVVAGWLVLSFTLLLTGAFVSTFAQQQQPPEFEKLLKRRNKGERNKVVGKKRERLRAPAVIVPKYSGGIRQTAARPSRQGSGRAGRRAAGWVAVTFVSDMPFVDIFMGNVKMKLGTIGRGMSLKRTLPRGKVNIGAVCPNRRAFDVELNIVSEDLQIEVTCKPDAPAKESKVASAPKPTYVPPPPPAPPPIKPEAVIGRYLDPKQAQGVKAEEWQQVLSQARAVLKVNANNPQLQWQEAFAQGQIAYLGGDYESAIEKFNNAGSHAQSDTEKPLAAYALAHAYLAANKLELAKKEFMRAIQLDPKFALAYKGLGEVYSKWRNYKDALGAFEQATLRGYPATETSIILGLKHNRARSMMERKRWDQALQELEEIEVLPAKYTYLSDVLTDIGICFEEGSKQQIKAYEYYQKAIEVDASNAWARYKFGKLMYKENDYANAREYLERASKLFEQMDDKVNSQSALKLSQKAAQQLTKKQ